MSSGATDIRIAGIGPFDWGNAFRYQKLQEERIPISSLQGRGGLISDKNVEIQERLFAWSVRVAVSAGLRRGDLLNTAPSTLALMGECLIGCAAKTKTRGKSEGAPRGASTFAYSANGDGWLNTGYGLSIG